VTAEVVLGNTGIKFVSSQLIFALQYSEIRSRHDQMLVSDHVAYAAVAIVQRKIRRRINLETNSSAMTAAFMCGHSRYSEFST
jgi:hypothetical protein